MVASTLETIPIGAFSQNDVAHTRGGKRKRADQDHRISVHSFSVRNVILTIARIRVPTRPSSGFYNPVAPHSLRSASVAESAKTNVGGLSPALESYISHMIHLLQVAVRLI